jgi:hypothetical protein
MSLILNLKRGAMLDLKLYYPEEEEMEKVLCCAKSCPDFRVINDVIS